ncbi:MAG: hypothetical protein QOF71_20 [Candidatus Eremiobacteraeota bacterium]|jgi:hypothetical protein|nr:hypothetical protein [Candidatus Eremiobacteraeota bacterium]
MDNLVLCPCGHSLANHDYMGCSGDRVGRCGCELDRHAALEAAVDTARTSPLYAASGYVNRAGDAA